MAYYSQNGSGIDSSAYIYVQLQVTRTDYATYSHFDLKSVAVSDTGTSGFIRGQVTTNQGGTSWTAATGWKDVYYNGTTTQDVVETDGEGKTAIYAVSLGLDGFHGISPMGDGVITSYMPDMNAPGAVKTGEVELVAGVALKNTLKAAVLKGIAIGA